MCGAGAAGFSARKGRGPRSTPLAARLCRRRQGAGYVRRLYRLGEADDHVALRLSEVRVTLDDWKPALVDGFRGRGARAALDREPASRRKARSAYKARSSSLTFAGTCTTTLPEAHGKVRGAGIELAAFSFAKDFDTDFQIANDEVRVKTLHATYGHAAVTVEDVTVVRPLAPGSSNSSAENVESRGLRFPKT